MSARVRPRDRVSYLKIRLQALTKAIKSNDKKRHFDVIMMAIPTPLRVDIVDHSECSLIVIYRHMQTQTNSRSLFFRRWR